MEVKFDIRDIQKAQALNNQAIAALKPQGAFGQAVKYITVGLHRHAVQITHVITGALRGSHRMSVSGTRGTISIDPSSVRPGGAKPYTYGPVEHARGGSHAFYDRTVAEAGQSQLNQGVQIIRRGIGW